MTMTPPISPELIPPLDLLISAASGVTVDGLKELARRRFATDADWYKALTPAMDRLRAQQRDALLGHILHTNTKTPRWKTADDVYAYLLIDVQMGPCQLSSRIVQAHSAVQLFVQRCLMNLEKPEEVALGDVSDITEWRQWDWMKNYRVWEAGRKVFLYPENWIEPDLRDVKSPFFEELENELLQDEITPDTAERAVRGYLQKLHEVARLDIRALYEETFDEPTGDGGMVTRRIIHMVGRTHAVPHVYYYRKRMDDRSWAPWKKIELSIDSDHLLLVVHNRRPVLFWAQFKEVQIPQVGRRNVQPIYDLAVSLSWSRLELDKWTPPHSYQIRTLFTRADRISLEEYREAWPLRGRIEGGTVVLDIYNDEGMLDDLGETYSTWKRVLTLHFDACIGSFREKLPDKFRLTLPLRLSPHQQRLAENAAGSPVLIPRFKPNWDWEENVQLLQKPIDDYALSVPHNHPQFSMEQPFVFSDSRRQYLVQMYEVRYPEIQGEIGEMTPGILPQRQRSAVRIEWQTAQRFRFETLYHPYLCLMVNALEEGGLAALNRPPEPTNSTWTCGPTVRLTKSSRPAINRLMSVGLGSRVCRRENASKR